MCIFTKFRFHHSHETAHCSHFSFPRFQLQQREALSPHHKLLATRTLPIPQLHLGVPPSHDAHPNFQIFKNNASESNNTNGISQKQRGEYRTHEWILCCWSHYHYISNNFVYEFLCKLDYDNNKFIHTPTSIYKKVMWLFEFVGVVKHK